MKHVLLTLALVADVANAQSAFGTALDTTNAKPGIAPTTARSAEPYAFAGLRWGSTPAVIQEALTAKGYEFVKVDDDGDIDFKGTIVNTPAHILALLDPSHRLVKVAVYLITADEDARQVYKSTVDQLRLKYGNPDITNASFDQPYYEGDGYEDQAIRAGKGHFASCWCHGERVKPGLDALCISIGKTLTVNLSYESAEWDKEADRRAARAAKDF